MFSSGNGLAVSIKWRTFSVTATLSGTDDYGLSCHEVPAIAVPHDSPTASKPAGKLPELGICFQPALCFAAFMDNVVINDQRDCFRPPISGFQVLQQSDKQR